MLTVLSVCKKDAAQALKLSGWIRELGNIMAHECLLAISKDAVDANLHEPILENLRHTFRKTDLYVVSNIEDATWPKGANHGFIRVCKDVIQNNRQKPFFWMEPDAIPLSKEWLNEIEREYILSNKPFMGAFVDLPGTKQHMSGIAVYCMVDSLAPSYVLSNEFAFDVVMADQVIPQAHFTQLICHQWKPEPFQTKEDLNRIPKSAVIYHQDKEGKIIDILRGGGCSVPKFTEGFPAPHEAVSPHEIPVAQPLTEKQLIEALVEKSKRSSLDRGRIIKQLRKHKLSK